MVDYYNYYDTYAWDFDSESYFESFGKPNDNWELNSQQRQTENIDHLDNTNIINSQKYPYDSRKSSSRPIIPFNPFL